MSDTLSNKKEIVKNSSGERPPNPRPTRPHPSFASTMRLATRGSENCKHSKPECADASPVARDEVVGDIQVEANKRQRSPGIAKVQGWLGMRSGVSAKLRKICSSGDEALILNQLVCYWFARDDENCIRARIIKARHRWVAKSHKEWADELGMTPKQARRCVEALRKKGLIEVRTWRFSGANTTHVRPLISKIARATGCPDDQRPYRRSQRGLQVTLTEKRERNEEREVAQRTRYMEDLGRELRESALTGSH